MRNFLDKVRAVQQCQRAMQAANDNLRQSLHDWNQVENTFTQISAEKKGGNLSEMLPSHWSVSSTLYSTANLLDKMVRKLHEIIESL